MNNSRLLGGPGQFGPPKISASLLVAINNVIPNTEKTAGKQSGLCNHPGILLPAPGHMDPLKLPIIPPYIIQVCLFQAILAA